MGALRMGAAQASMVWLEPHRVHAGGRTWAGTVTADLLAEAREAFFKFDASPDGAHLAVVLRAFRQAPGAEGGEAP